MEMENICEASNKRSRSQNWDENEKTVLIQAIKPALNIIESKKKSTTTNREKSIAWNNVLTKLSAQGYNRDNLRVKEQWQRMKVQAKRNISSFKKQKMATGGGPPPTEPSDVDWEIKDLLPYEFEEDVNIFDSDGCLKVESNNTPASFATPTTSRNETEKSSAAVVVELDHWYTHQDLNIIDVEPIVSDDDSVPSTLPSSTKRKRLDAKPEQSYATPCKTRKTKIGLSEYEEKLYELNRKRIQQVMDQAEELHVLKINNEKEFHKERMRLLRLQYTN